MYTLGEAARATGKNKTTIARAIQAGKISATRNPDGSYTIDPAELHRVFSVTPGYSPAPVEAQQSTTDDVTLAVMEERIKNLEGQVQDLMQQRDQWHAQAEQLTRLLTATNTQPAQPAPLVTPALETQPAEPTVTPSRPWWRRLLGE